MSYTMIEDYTSPNQSPRSAYGWNGNPDGITWHHWNWPHLAGTFESTINFFCSTAAETSAHFIVSDKRVACIVSPSEAAWQAGSNEGNGRTIGIEVDPNMPGDTLETCAELAADMERQFGSLNHYAHKDWSATECPGEVGEHIPWLIERTNEILGNGGGSSGGTSSSGGGNMEAAIAWFQNRAGAVNYSMDYRNGPGSYDCSSAVYYSLMDAGINTSGKVGNTESMFSDLPAWGFREVQATAAGIPAQRGDIFVWGDPGSSAGAAGHTGIFVDPDNIIHCNYGYNGITVNNHDYIWSANGSPPCHIFRYYGGGSSPVYKQTVSKDWFDMASRQDLAEVVNDVLHQNDGFIRQCIHNVLHNEKFSREGSVNGKPVGGQTTLVAEAQYAAQNFGRLKADVLWAQKQIAELSAEVKELKEGK